MLSAVRRVTFATRTRVFRGPGKLFMSTFEDRERGAEAKYIRDEEAKRQAALREQMERILALEDSHAEKQGLVAVLGKFCIILFPLL